MEHFKTYGCTESMDTTAAPRSDTTPLGSVSAGLLKYFTVLPRIVTQRRFQLFLPPLTPPFLCSQPENACALAWAVAAAAASVAATSEASELLAITFGLFPLRVLIFNPSVSSG